jgi:hypothetical protein
VVLRISKTVRAARGSRSRSALGAKSDNACCTQGEPRRYADVLTGTTARGSVLPSCAVTEHRRGGLGPHG